MGAEALWPLVKGGVIVIVVLGAIAMIFRQIRKRGRAEAERDSERAQGVRNDEADEIMAEPTTDAGSFSDRLHDELSED